MPVRLQLIGGERPPELFTGHHPPAPRAPAAPRRFAAGTRVRVGSVDGEVLTSRETVGGLVLYGVKLATGEFLHSVQEPLLVS